MSAGDVSREQGLGGRGMVAVALSLACSFAILDILTGALLVGARLGAVVTDSPLVLVALLGLAGYFLWILGVAVTLRGFGSRLPILRGSARLETVALTVPVAALGLLFIGLGVGQDSTPAWVGGRWVTVLLTLAIAGMVILLPVLRRQAGRDPIGLVLMSLLFVLVTWVALGAAGASS